MLDWTFFEEKNIFYIIVTREGQITLGVDKGISFWIQTNKKKVMMVPDKSNCYIVRHWHNKCIQKRSVTTTSHQP